MYLKSFIILFIIAFYSASYANADERPWRGPLFITNNFPTALIFFSSTAEDVRITPVNALAYKIGITESNTIIIDKKSDTEALIDLELTRLHLNFYKGLTKNLEAGLEIPILFYHRGIMDGPIEGVEKIIGKTTRVRKERRRNDIRYFIKRDGDVLYDLDKNISGIGDMTLKLKYALLKNKQLFPDITVKFDFKIPTGNRDLALGSGEWDFGPALIFHKGFDRLHFFFNAGYFIFNDLKLDSFKERVTTTRIETTNFFTGSIAAEYVFNNLSAVLQFSTNGNPFKKFGIQDLDSGGSAMSFGVKYDLNDYNIQISATENIGSVGFPDFSVDLILEHSIQLP